MTYYFSLHTFLMKLINFLTIIDILQIQKKYRQMIMHSKSRNLRVNWLQFMLPHIFLSKYLFGVIMLFEKCTLIWVCAICVLLTH